MFQSPILFLFTIEITSTWQICYKEDMRKYIKWNCNIVDSNSVIIWNSAHLRQKSIAETKLYFFGGFQKKIWGTPMPVERMNDHMWWIGQPHWGLQVKLEYLEFCLYVGVREMPWSCRGRGGKCIHYQTIAAIIIYFVVFLLI